MTVRFLLLVSFSGLVFFLVIVVPDFIEVFGMSVSWEMEQSYARVVHTCVHACLITFGSVRNGDYYYQERRETKRFVSRHIKDFTVPFRLLN